MDRRIWLPSLVVAVPMFVMLLSIGYVSPFFIGLVFGVVYFAAVVVVLVAVLLGVPLLLVPGVRAWWTTHPWLSWLIAGVGFILFVLSGVAFGTTDVWTDDEGFTSQSLAPQPILALVGIVVFAFGVVHLPWKRRLTVARSFRLDLGRDRGPKLLRPNEVWGDDQQVVRRMLVAAALTALAIVVMMLSVGRTAAVGSFLFIGVVCLEALFVAGAAFVLGLPLRLIRPARTWWAAHPWISWAIAGVGLTVFALARILFATHEADHDGGGTFESHSPNLAIAVVGIVVFAFGVVHIYWRRRSKVEAPEVLPAESPWLNGGPRHRELP